MVFPSIRCLTCKDRHVKCDASRPRCDRCRKGNRDCFWEHNNASPTDIPFKSENAFASGRPRRPRKRFGINPKPQSGMISAYNPIRLNLPRVDLPIEIYAYQYWIENLASWPDDLFDVGQEYGAGARYHLNCTREKESSLYLAVSAFSLAIFGRVNNVYEALTRAERHYSRSITELRRELEVLSNDTIDQLLITTMILSKYDNIMYGFRVQNSSKWPPSTQGSSPSFLGSYAHHYKGTASLLKARQERGYTQNLHLEKAIRRTIIRAHLHSVDPVPAWLQDGHYGEPDPALALDFLMMKAASLQSRTIILVNQANGGINAMIHFEAAFKTMLAEAQALDRLFAQWAQGIPQNWKFTAHKSPSHDAKELSPEHHSIFYERQFYCFATHGHAVVWNRYHAVRLLVSSIQMELLSHLVKIRAESLGIAYLEQSTACQKTINDRVTDLCRGIPFFYLSNTGVGHDRRYTDLATELANLTSSVSSKTQSLMMAVLLAWPISIAVRVGEVPADQMEWLKCRLQAVTQRIGSLRLPVASEK